MIRSLTTRFFLTHVTTGCLLRSHNVILPQWGFKQAEVLCQKKPDRTSTFNMWNIEKHVNDRRKTSSSHSLLVPKGGVNQYRSRFLKDFWDLNVAMWTSNNALVPDPDKEPEIITSQAYQWPLALTGLRMCSWDDNSIKFYMIGNPLVWWGGTLSLVIVSGLFLVYIMRQHRQIREWKYGKSPLLMTLICHLLKRIGVTLCLQAKWVFWDGSCTTFPFTLWAEFSSKTKTQVHVDLYI